MKKSLAMKVDHVSMKFNLSSEKVDNIKEYMIKMLKKELMYQEFWALRDINFEVKRGDRLGIMGLNGAGKSTLLKIVSGVLKATEGTVTTNGKIAPLLELGAGFDRQYTGSENIFLYGSMLGYSKEFLKDKYDEIVKFSELGNFINVPVKNYSSGMKARLGFAVATMVKPEILIVDEVLAVGDFLFRKKCQNRMQEMLSGGTTLLFVSHNLEQVRSLCDHALWLDKGVAVMSGEAQAVCDAYQDLENKTP